MAEDDDLLLSRAILVRGEHSAVTGRRREDVEEPGGRACADHALGILFVGEIEAGVLDRGDVAERADGLHAVHEVARAHVASVAAELLVDGNDPFRVGDWNRPQNNGVHRAENGGCGADAERQRDDGHGRESRVAQQLANGKPDVVRELGEIFGAAHVSIPSAAYSPAGRVYTIDVAEALDGGLARGRRFHAAGHELADPHLDVELELRVDLLVHAAAPDPRTQPLSEFHIRPAAALSKRRRRNAPTAPSRLPAGGVPST